MIEFVLGILISNQLYSDTIKFITLNLFLIRALTTELVSPVT